MAAPADTIKSILEDNWDDSNTSSKTPTVKLITEVRTLDFNTNPYYILVYRPMRRQEPAGAGGTHKNVFHEVKIDLRVMVNESIFTQMIEEIERILDSKIALQDGTYNILNPDKDGQDLSDKQSKIYRYLITCELRQHAKVRNP